MRRADRLFDIVQLLRAGRLRTAQELADKLEVSVRTIYRDIDTLAASGVPVEGERGVGYILREGMLLPPLMFSALEIEAMALGAKMVRAWGDDDLARAAEEALVKVDAVIGVEKRDGLWRQELKAFGLRLDSPTRLRLKVIRQALRHSRKVLLTYPDSSGTAVRRTVRPLGLEAWGHAWTLTGWCELRRDFRAFRVDRVVAVEVLPDTFRPERGRTMRDFLARLKAQGWASVE